MPLLNKPFVVYSLYIETGNAYEVNSFDTWYEARDCCVEYNKGSNGDFKYFYIEYCLELASINWEEELRTLLKEGK